MKKALCVIIVLTLAISLYVFLCPEYEAEFKSVGDNSLGSIIYDNCVYVEWNMVADEFCTSGAVKSSDMLPYYLISDDLHGKVYISGGFFYDLLPPYSYFSFCGDSNDFVFQSPDDTSLNILYVKNDFIFPNIVENEIDEIWMSLSIDNADNITDEKTVEKIVGLVKSGDDFGTNEDIYSYISEKSCDGCRIFMKYKGYPLVEEFVITEKDNCRYVITQR